MPLVRPSAKHVLHLAFFLLVASSATRMIVDNSPHCPYIVGVSTLLALSYAGGLRFASQLGRWRPAWVGVLLALWAILLAATPATLANAYAWCAVPLACVAVQALDRRLAVAAAGIIGGTLLAVLVRQAGGLQPDLILAPIAAVWATLALHRRLQREAVAQQRLIDELRDTRAELARQQREAGTSEERARIARDLHDTLAQELAAGRMLLQAADREWWRHPERARERVRSVTETLGANLLETRRIIDDLTPSELDQQSLPAALQEICLRAQQSGAAPRVLFTGSPDSDPVDAPEAAAALLRVVQGALANVRDHAGADTVVVSLGRCGDRITLSISDNGVGFIPGRPSPTPGRGFGLAASRERLAGYGGSVTVDSEPGRGTTITAVLPLPRDAGLATVA
jgi:signal transduction histidine kinase